MSLYCDSPPLLTRWAPTAASLACCLCMTSKDSLVGFLGVRVLPWPLSPLSSRTMMSSNHAQSYRFISRRTCGKPILCAAFIINLHVAPLHASSILSFFSSSFLSYLLGKITSLPVTLPSPLNNRRLRPLACLCVQIEIHVANQ